MSFLIVCAAYLAEACFIALLFKPGTLLWPRTLLASLVFLPWVAFSSSFVVHAPMYFHVHIVWTWLLLAVLVATTLGSGLRHLFGRSTIQIE